MKKSWKRVITMVLSGALVFTAADYSSVNTAQAAKKATLKLSKTKASLNVGKKLTLKITKKNVKKIKSKKWTTSKKSVATVTKKGKVTAKKAGKATIKCVVKYTVKGSKKTKKKTLKCKVTVKATYSIKSVQVVNPYLIRVTLNQKYALSQSDFVVKTREDGTGTYNKTLTIGSVSNSSQKVYDLTLADLQENDPDAQNNTVYDGDYVQVTIKKLNGTKKAETTYTASSANDNHYLTGMVGTHFSENVLLSNGLTTTGFYSGVKVNGTLPAGITAKVNSSAGVVRFRGIPTAVANGTKVTVTGKDEKGRSLTQTVLFYIGSKDTIVTYAESEHKTFLVNDHRGENFYAIAVGGSGDYEYSWTPVSNSLIHFYGGEVSIQAYTEQNNVKAYLPAGAYNFTYTVADQNNANIKASGSVNTVGITGTEVSGKITTADGTVLEDADFYASFEDKSHQYYDEGGTSVSTDEKGEYSTAIVPSQTYQIYGVKGNASKGYHNQKIGSTKLTYNFALPIYKINISLPSGLTYDFCRVRNEDGNTVDRAYSSQNYVYLTTGYYTFTTEATSKTGEWWNGFKLSTATYKAETTVGNAAQTVSLVLDPNGYNYSPDQLYGGAKNAHSFLVEGEVTSLNGEADYYDDGDDEVRVDYYALRFSPMESGDYDLSGEAYLYDAAKDEPEKLPFTEVDGKKRYTLTEGQEYIVANEGYNADEISIRKAETTATPEVTEAPEATATPEVTATPEATGTPE